MGKDKYMDGFKYDVPAEKLGYIQKLGAGRMAPGKKGDETAMKMMHGDAAAKYYDGAGMYMNGAPKYEGASKSYMGPMTPGHGGAAGHEHDTLPSYTTTSVDVTRSGGGGSSSTSSGNSQQTQTTGVSYKKAYEKADKDKYPTLGSFTKAAKEYNKSNSTSSSGGSSSSSSESKVDKKVNTETNTIGDQTQKDILDAGRIATTNRASLRNAERENAMNQSQLDSINRANKGINKSLQFRPLSQSVLNANHRSGNRAGYQTLLSARGSDGARLFSTDEAKQMYNTGSQMMVGTGEGENPNRKISKRNPEVRELDTNTGSLGSLPTMADYEGGSKMGHNAPKMNHSPMKFGMNSSKGTSSSREETPTPMPKKKKQIKKSKT